MAFQLPGKYHFEGEQIVQLVIMIKMTVSHVSLKSLTNCQESFTLRGNTQELALGADSTQRSTYPIVYILIFMDDLNKK